MRTPNCNQCWHWCWCKGNTQMHQTAHEKLARTFSMYGQSIGIAGHWLVHSCLLAVLLLRSCLSNSSRCLLQTHNNCCRTGCNDSDSDIAITVWLCPHVLQSKVNWVKLEKGLSLSKQFLLLMIRIICQSYGLTLSDKKIGSTDAARIARLIRQISSTQRIFSKMAWVATYLVVIPYWSCTAGDLDNGFILVMNPVKMLLCINRVTQSRTARTTYQTSDLSVMLMLSFLEAHSWQLPMTMVGSFITSLCCKTNSQSSKAELILLLNRVVWEQFTAAVECFVFTSTHVMLKSRNPEFYFWSFWQQLSLVCLAILAALSEIPFTSYSSTAKLDLHVHQSKVSILKTQRQKRWILYLALWALPSNKAS